MIELRRVSAIEANVRKRLGAGHRLEFSGNPQPGSITFSHRPSSNLLPRVTPLLSSSGAIGISEPSKLLRLLTDTPLITPDGCPDLTEDTPELYWTLASKQLAPEISTMLGELIPIKPQHDEASHSLQELNSGIIIDWEVQTGTLRANGAAVIPATTLNNLLTKGNWKPVRSNLPDHFVVKLPLLLGQLSLPYQSCQQLQPGDVVVPQTALFSTTGKGLFEIGKLRIMLDWAGIDHQSLYKVTSIEDVTMNDILNDYDINPTDEDIESRLARESSEYDGDSSQNSYDEPSQQQSYRVDAEENSSHARDRLNHEETPGEANQLGMQKAFGSLPLNLTVESGQLSLTVADLQKLAVGSLLTVAGTTPGQALLRYEGQTVARGELVDIEGRLGLQITSVELN
ncbi:FliM/FliN family flagellar motor switch protein [Motiliproteus sp. MSK22-1]|uniref:FliM/FliN family flagellar motor switch protein n=1 Tax=Motiliproteus sp. MSK22-1 TaxID=1897630 RepID=UPI001300FB0D|nr:FliM/FliN family flagellar motor switch protein [Motiliproteus sp. MSK22-1]